MIIHRKSLIYATLASGAVSSLISLVIMMHADRHSAPEPRLYEPVQATLTGTIGCLPPRDPDAPSTRECRTAIRLESGEYYALDFGLMSSGAPAADSGDRITASGIVTPIERLSSDQWQKYEVKGIFSVTEVESTDPAPIAPAKPASPAPAPQKPCFVGGCSSQLCTDAPDAVSTCEYRSEYGCYKAHSTCGRQADGSCGWAQTPELKACLASPPAL